MMRTLKVLLLGFSLLVATTSCAALFSCHGGDGATCTYGGPYNNR